MNRYYRGFTVRNRYGNLLAANDEAVSSEEGNALEYSTHFTIFETTEAANEFIVAVLQFRVINCLPSLGPYIIEEVVLGWV